MRSNEVPRYRPYSSGSIGPRRRVPRDFLLGMTRNGEGAPGSDRGSPNQIQTSPANPRNLSFISYFHTGRTSRCNGCSDEHLIMVFVRKLMGVSYSLCICTLSFRRSQSRRALGPPDTRQHNNSTRVDIKNLLPAGRLV